MSSGPDSLMAAAAAHAPRRRTRRPPRAPRRARRPAGTGSIRCRSPRPRRPSTPPSFPGRMPPTANTGDLLRQHRAPRLQRGRRQRLRRKHLEAVGARGDRRECFGRRRHARRADEPRRLRRAHDRGVGVRHHDQPPAGVADARDVGDVDDGAGTDEAVVAMPLREQRDRRERARRIERHLEHAEARLEQRAGDAGDLLGRDAAQHRDQRQRREKRCEGIHVALISGASAASSEVHPARPPRDLPQAARGGVGRPMRRVDARRDERGDVALGRAHRRR